MKSNYLLRQIPFILLFGLACSAQANEIKWEEVNNSLNQTNKVEWHVVPASNEITKNRWEILKEKTTISDTVGDKKEDVAEKKNIAQEKKFPVTGGVFHVKRNDEFLPAISHFIPIGYGASFGHASIGLWLEDCLTAGGKTCGGTNEGIHPDGQTWLEEFNMWGKGRVVTEVGLGDPNNFVGLDVAFQFTSLATTRPGQDGEGTPFGSGQGLDLAISRNITPDWGIKIGARNIAKFDEEQLDSGRSAFGVTSMRFDLGGNTSENSNDLYVTVGLGNGRMRPLRAIVEDQKRECQKDERKYGKRTRNQFVEHCIERGFDYGTPWPIASIAYMANPQLSFIAEWMGRNLTLGASIKPFEDINWVITPAITSIIRNSDWDPEVPGYTERMRFNLTTSIGF